MHRRSLLAIRWESARCDKGQARSSGPDQAAMHLPERSISRDQPFASPEEAKVKRRRDPAVLTRPASEGYRESHQNDETKKRTQNRRAQHNKSPLPRRKPSTDPMGRRCRAFSRQAPARTMDAQADHKFWKTGSRYRGGRSRRTRCRCGRKRCGKTTTASVDSVKRQGEGLSDAAR